MFNASAGKGAEGLIEIPESVEMTEMGDTGIDASRGERRLDAWDQCIDRRLNT
jgi:hypothetical protein